MEDNSTSSTDLARLRAEISEIAAHAVALAREVERLYEAEELAAGPVRHERRRHLRIVKSVIIIAGAGAMIRRLLAAVAAASVTAALVTAATVPLITREAPRAPAAPASSPARGILPPDPSPRPPGARQQAPAPPPSPRPRGTTVPPARKAPAAPRPAVSTSASASVTVSVPVHLPAPSPSPSCSGIAVSGACVPL